MNIATTQGAFFNVLGNMAALGPAGWIHSISTLKDSEQEFVAGTGVRVATTALRHWALDHQMTDSEGTERTLVNRLADLNSHSVEVGPLIHLFRPSQDLIAQAVSRLSQKVNEGKDPDWENLVQRFSRLQHSDIPSTGTLFLKSGFVVFVSDFFPDDFLLEELSGAFTSLGGSYPEWMMEGPRKRLRDQGKWSDQATLSQSTRKIVKQFHEMLRWYDADQPGSRENFEFLTWLKDPTVLRMIFMKVEVEIIRGIQWEDSDKGGGTLSRDQYNELIAEAVGSVWKSDYLRSLAALVRSFDYFPEFYGEGFEEETLELKSALERLLFPPSALEPKTHLVSTIDARNTVVSLGRSIAEKFEVGEKLDILLRTIDQIIETEFLSQKQKKRLLQLLVSHADPESMDIDTEAVWSGMVSKVARLVQSDVSKATIASIIADYSPDGVLDALADDEEPFYEPENWDSYLQEA